MAGVAAYLDPNIPNLPDQSHFEAGDGNDSDIDGLTDNIFTDCEGTEDDGLGPVHITAPDSAAPIVDGGGAPPPGTGDPENWAVPPPNAAAGEPPFSDVDNPFNAGSFVFRPKIENGVYPGHSLPTGACPVCRKGRTGCGRLRAGRVTMVARPTQASRA